MEFWTRWRRRQKPFTSSHNQKKSNNQSKINKRAEAPENQPAWNSDNEGIKEKLNQNNQTGKVADRVGQPAEKHLCKAADRAGRADLWGN